MQVVLVIVGVALSPWLSLALLLWLAHLEDTLPRDVLRASRKPAPPPILAIPVRRPVPAQVMTVPEQRAVPDVEVATAPAAQAV
jgi:hypothetical protein